MGNEFLTLAHQKQDIVTHSVNTELHLEIYKLAISFREEFMASKNLIGEKFMIPCQNIHPWMGKNGVNQVMVYFRRK